MAKENFSKKLVPIKSVLFPFVSAGVFKALLSPV